ncbi:MAG TPA: DUF92 domain-containing protein [Vicinamibacterales bacterium]
MNRDGTFSEDARQLVHIAMGAFALALPYLAWWQAVALACLAVLFNLFVLQSLLGRRLFRPGERIGRLGSGIVLYPVSVLGMLLLFRHRLDIVAAAWGALAVGDGMATIVGRRLPIAAIPWNRAKSVGGSLAFAILGSAAAVGLTWWCRELAVPPAPPWFFIVAPILAAVAAAAVETIPVSLDDNVSVSITAVSVMWIVSLISEDLLSETVRSLGPTVIVAAAANAAVAVAGYLARTVTISGMLTGFLLGTVIFVATGAEGWILLLVCFASAVVTSRIGLARKHALGIAEEKGGRRGGGNAFANTGVAAIAAILVLLSYAHTQAAIAFVAALVAGASDTVASEIGKAFGKRTFLVTTLRMVRPGTPGAMSLEGTVAGIAAAAALSAVASALGLMPVAFVIPVTLAATAGALVESALGATLEPRGVLNNDLLNFINTAVAAFAAIGLSGLA